MASSAAAQGAPSMCSRRPKRDCDLLIPDEILTDVDFDKLWDWFASVVETNLDRQLIFVKLVNSVRKPYLDHCRRNLTGPSRRLFPWQTGSTCYTPSECTTTEYGPVESQQEEERDLEELASQVEALQLQLQDASSDLAKKDNEICSLKMEVQTVSAALQDASSDLAKKDNEICSLKMEVQTVSAALQDASSDITQKDNEICSLKMEVQTVSAALQDASSDLPKKGNEVCSLRMEVQTISAALQDASSDLAKKGNEICSLNMELQTVSVALQDASSDIAQKDNEICSLKMEAQTVSVALQDASSDLAKKDNEICSLKMEVQTVSVALQDASSDLAQKDNEICSLKMEVQTVSAVLQDASSDLAKKGNEICSLKMELQTVSAALQEKSQVHAQFSTPGLESPSMPCVAMMSSQLPNKFVRMNSNEVSPYGPRDNGIVSVNHNVWIHEIFVLKYYPGDIIAFQSSVYLRATCDCSDLSPGIAKEAGGGVVDCRYIREGSSGCSIQEKFRIRRLGVYQQLVAIESVAFPGRYLSLDGESGTVTLQGARGDRESFYVIFVAS
ncbi:hypothetical protein BDZ91DRAFT_853375 [Kalaharituber pfeilii]|nr:hypothetical protein BDZ91DRAFT_853375 [Kalaharituber pfeilii]